jgi:putative ABC transport system permease protein
VVPFGTKSFDDPSLLPGHEKHAILSLSGVTSVEERAVGCVAWRKLSGGAATALVVGLDAQNSESLPWDTIGGKSADLSSSNAGAVDPTNSKELGIHNRSDRAEVNNMRVTPQVITWGIRSFRTLPYVITRCGLARHFSRDSTQLIVMTSNLALLLLPLRVGMCLFAPIAILKLTRIDPAVVCRR